MHFCAYIVLISTSNGSIIYRRMGCVNSKTDINDLHPNVFQVMNVDDLGNLIAPGRLEITESDIVLCQRGKPPVKWPLKCLRRYGYDAEIFSFESGRRCSTGPGIYAFKCRRAAQLFNLVQTNIQLVCTNGEDNISREMSLNILSGPSALRTLPVESNYLDPMPVRNNSRIISSYPYNQQNEVGRLNSIGSSSGPMSPQGTMGSPSPPPTLPQSMPPPPPVSHVHQSSSYVNEEVLHLNLCSDTEHNNNKSLSGQAMHRSHTVSSSTSSSGLLSCEPICGQVISSELSIAHNRSSGPVQPCIPSYINVDLAGDTSPLSASQSPFEIIVSQKEDPGVTLDCFNGSEPTYINVSSAQEKVESSVIMLNTQPQPNSILYQQSSSEDVIKHCYANLEACEIESLKKRFSTNSINEKLSLQSQTTPPLVSNTTGIRAVSYAVLDLDRKDALLVNTTTVITTVSTATALTTELSALTLSSSLSPPDSPVKSQKIGYVTIDFNKTVALSQSANSSLINDVDEGSRKTRHNSTISELITPSTRRNSSMSE